MSKVNVIEGSRRKNKPDAKKGYEYIIDATCVSCQKIFTLHCKYIENGTGKCGSCRTTTHGLYGTRAYHAWAEMKKRCDNPKQVFYHHYGGRGITYDLKWKTFEGFLEDMGHPNKPTHTIDRVDSDGNYSKENCRWVSHIENCNNRRNHHWITFNHRTQTLSQWAREIGISPTTLNTRLKNWGKTDAMTRPPAKK